MPIFKVRSKGTTVREGKLVGAYIPLQVSSYLSLYVLANGISKSIILRDLVDEWYRDKRVSAPEDDLIEKVATGAINAWRASKTRVPNADFPSYQEVLTRELEKRGITSFYIEIILKKVQDEEDKISNPAE